MNKPHQEETFTADDMVKDGNRTVVVEEEGVDIRFTTAKREVHTIGRLVTDKYQGEGVNRYTLKTEHDEHHIGLRKDAQGHVVSPHLWQKALFDAGVEPKKVYQNKGNITMVATVDNMPALEDVITWDEPMWKDIWSSGEKSKLGELIPSVMMKVNLNSGMRIKRGIFRLVCTNGMTDDFMKLPTLSMSHASFDKARIEEFVDSSLEFSLEDLTGQTVCERPESLTPVINYIENILSEQDAPKKNPPVAIARSMNYIANRPKWYLEMVNAQLIRMRNNKDGNYHQFDFLNVTTNPITLQEVMQRRSPSSQTRNLQGTIDQAPQLATALAEVANLYDYMMI